MDGLEELDRRGQELLEELAADPGSECWKDFYALYFEPVWRYLFAKRAVLNARVSRYLKVDGLVAPDIQPSEVREVTHDATLTALGRVRENAGRFDPHRGTATMWVLCAAEWAWIDVCKAIAKARRSDRLQFVEPDDLVDEVDRNPTTEEHVLRHLQDAEALADAACHVNENEFAALRLVVTGGYSYAEAAMAIFGDETMTKRVDHLLTRGKRKLAEAWSDRRPSPNGASGSKLQGRADDKERSDG
jgi:DNA-directed RNA polymerase specialized sigma24 family protein